jgi:hypothetical protein
MPICLQVCRSISISSFSICLSVCLSLCLACLSVCVVCLPACQPAYNKLCLSVFLPICISLAKISKFSLLNKDFSKSGNEAKYAESPPWLHHEAKERTPEGKEVLAQDHHRSSRPRDKSNKTFTLVIYAFTVVLYKNCHFYTTCNITFDMVKQGLGVVSQLGSMRCKFLPLEGSIGLR